MSKNIPTGRRNGRPPKPVEVHRRNGNPSKKRLPPAPGPGAGLVEVGVGVVPVAPVGLGKVGVAAWVMLWSAGRAHLAEGHDSILVGLVCRGLNQIALLENFLGDDVGNRFYVTASGQILSHPAVKQIEVLDVHVTGWLSSLGFSPSDRARLGLQEVRTRNELDAYRERSERKRRGAGVVAGVVDAEVVSQF